MPDQHQNFAYSTVAAAPSPATTGTSLDVASGDGALFPDPPFNATVWPAGEQPLADNAEIVRVTGVSTDTLTIVREQEGTTARTVVNGDQIAATITAKTLTDAETNGLVTYTYDDSSTADSDPGTGNLRFDNADPTSAGFIYIADVDASGLQQDSYLQSWMPVDVSSSGWLRLSSVADPTKWVLYAVNGAVVNASGYSKIPVLAVGGGALPTTAGDIRVEFTFSDAWLTPYVSSSDPSFLSAIQTGQLWFDTDDANGGTVSNGRLKAITVINQGTTSYSVPSDVRALVVECIGSGGGGGGADGGSSNAGCPGGGGGGGYCRKFYSVSGGESITVTVGAKGAGGTAGNNAGSNGNVTEFDTTAVLATKMSAKGGTGGASMAAGTGVAFALGGDGAAVATGGDVNMGGQYGQEGHRLSGTAGRSGGGGNGPLGGGGGNGQNIGSAVGKNATSYGAGGGGGISNNTTDRAGGDASDGVIIIHEYF